MAFKKQGGQVSCCAGLLIILAAIAIIVIVIMNSGSGSTDRFASHSSSSPPQSTKTREVANFMDAFAILNQRSGNTLFSHAEYRGDGIINVIATGWTRGTTAEKQSSLRTIYELWDAAERSTLPIAVYVVNQDGYILMKESGTSQ